MDKALLGEKTRQQLYDRRGITDPKRAYFRGKDLKLERVPGITNDEFSCSRSPKGRERIVTDVQNPRPGLFELRIAEDKEAFDIHRFKVEIINYLLKNVGESFDEVRLTINQMTGEVRRHHPFHVKTDVSDSMLSEKLWDGNTHLRGRNKNIHTTYDGGLTGFWDETHDTTFWDWRMGL